MPPVRTLASLMLAGLLACAGTASAIEYRFFDLGTLGGQNSFATGINNAGQVVGAADLLEPGSDENVTHAVRWTGTTATDLGTLPGPHDFTSVGYAINEAGDVAGTSGLHAVVWHGTHATDLHPAGNNASQATGLNNRGQAVGYVLPSVIGHDFSRGTATLWNGTHLTTLPPIEGGALAASINDAGQISGLTKDASSDRIVRWAGSASEPTGLWSGSGNGHGVGPAINEAGHVAGFTGDAAQPGAQAMLWEGGTPIVLEGSNTAAFGLNDRDQVVGMALGQSGEKRAVMWDRQKLADLTSLLTAEDRATGWHLTDAVDINDSGFIVGNAYHAATDTHHAYLLSPIPEPQTVLLWLGGLSLVAFALYRHRASCHFPRTATDSRRSRASSRLLHPA